jgi:2-iminobutanoate/2-iminopropanoate deaminase
MQPQVVRTEGAAPPAAHYSQAKLAGNLIYTAGCVGIDPATGAVVDGGLDAQVRRTLQNIEAILQAAGSDLSRVLKTTCYLTRQEDFATFDRAYREFFPTDPPARTTIICHLVREDLLVEVEAVAVTVST